jgi:hypothetical protein
MRWQVKVPTTLDPDSVRGRIEIEIRLRLSGVLIPLQEHKGRSDLIYDRRL